jgi:hypothetical protein
MADQIAINVKVITDEVQPKLRQVGKTVRDELNQIQQSAKNNGIFSTQFLSSLFGARSAFQNINGVAKQTGSSLRSAFSEGRAGAQRLAEALHPIDRVLQAIGLGVAQDFSMNWWPVPV